MEKNDWSFQNRRKEGNERIFEYTMTYFFEEGAIPGLPEGEHEVHLDIFATPYVPAKISGPPEDCYPEEGGEWEIINGYVLYKGKKYRLDQIRDDIYFDHLDRLEQESKNQWEKDL